MCRPGGLSLLAPAVCQTRRTPGSPLRELPGIDCRVGPPAAVVPPGPGPVKTLHRGPPAPVYRRSPAAHHEGYGSPRILARVDGTLDPAAADPEHSNVSVANENPGSLTGSQRPPAPGHARPHPAIPGAARRHIRPHPA